MGFQAIGSASRGVRAPDGHGLLRQTYEGTPLPQGVIKIAQTVFADDWGGSFKEVIRLDDGIVAAKALREAGVTLRPAQMNVSVISPGTRKFWHVHPTQSELWTIAHGQINAGLVDCREDSPTFGLRAKVVLTPQVSLFIPAGVAHGYANESSTTAVLLYLPDRQFSAGDDTEEWRIDPDALGIDFVLAEVI